MQNQAALLVIDVQNDFCPGGALAVPDGGAIIPLINRLAARHREGAAGAEIVLDVYDKEGCLILHGRGISNLSPDI